MALPEAQTLIQQQWYPRFTPTIRVTPELPQQVPPEAARVVEQRVVQYLEDSSETDLAAIIDLTAGSVVADLVGRTRDEAQQLVDALGLTLKATGTGRVDRQDPAPGTLVPFGTTVQAVLVPPPPAVTPTLPTPSAVLPEVPTPVVTAPGRSPSTASRPRGRGGGWVRSWSCSGCSGCGRCGRCARVAHRSTRPRHLTCGSSPAPTRPRSSRCTRRPPTQSCWCRSCPAPTSAASACPRSRDDGARRPVDGPGPALPGGRPRPVRRARPRPRPTPGRAAAGRRGRCGPGVASRATWPTRRWG